MKKQIEVRIAKTDEHEQTATGLIYAPLSIDSQGDFMTAPDIKSASQRFMKSGRTRAVDVNHSGHSVDAFIAESMISKGGDFPEGSWVVTAKIEDTAVWEAVRDGKLTGFSMLGTGNKHVAKLNGKDANRITDLDVQAISLVSKAANQEKFSVIKSDKNTQVPATTLENLAKTIDGINQAIAGITAQFDEQDRKLAAIASGRPVEKAAPDPNYGKIDYRLRQEARLQERLEAIMDRPDLFPEGAEHDVRRKLEKTADKLFALGHQPTRTTLDSNSAFRQRGGTSTYMHGNVSTLDDVLGISRNTRELQKHEDEISLNCLVL